MAMDSVVLSTLIKTKLETKFAWPVYDAAELQKFTDSIAEAVIEHLTSSAVVSASAVNGGLDTGNDTLVSNSITGGIS